MRRRDWISWLSYSILFSGLAATVTVWIFRHAQETPPEVKVTRVDYRDVANLVMTNGTVEPVTEFQARANFPGMVQTVVVQLADKVHAGQMLVTMKDPFAVSRVATAESAVAGATENSQIVADGGTREEQIALRSDLEHARSAADSAQQGLDALEKLYQQGAASAGEVEAAKRRVKDATVTLQALEQRSSGRYSPSAIHAVHARMEDARAALGAAKIAFNNANIASPISGTVYSVSVSPYDYVPMGADLIRVADLDKMQIRAYFDEPEVGKLKEGQPVTVTWEGRPGMTWHGHIRKAPVAAMRQGTRSVAECLIQIEDSHGDLLPNTQVIVRVPIESHAHVLSVPREALEVDTQGGWVFRVDGDRLVRTRVTPGLINLERAEIVQGLAAGDVVAVKAVDDRPLRDGLLVRIHP